MSESTPPGVGTAGTEVAPRSGQPLLVSVLSIAAIALTALLFGSLGVQPDVVTALATAAGALIPTVAIRVRDRKTSKARKVEEAVSGTFERPWIYTLLIGTALLVASELAGIWIVTNIEDALLGPFFAAFMEGWTGGPEGSVNLETSRGWANLTLILEMLTVLVAAVPCGSYVARRLKRNDLWCALGAVVLALVTLRFAVGVTVESPAEADPPLVVIVALGVLSVVVGVVLGVLRGRKSRSLFLVKRLFKGLTESDRSAVLDIMADAQAAGRFRSEGRGPDRPDAHGHRAA